MTGGSFLMGANVAMKESSISGEAGACFRWGPARREATSLACRAQTCCRGNFKSSRRENKAHYGPISALARKMQPCPVCV